GAHDWLAPREGHRTMSRPSLDALQRFSGHCPSPSPQHRQRRWPVAGGCLAHAPAPVRAFVAPDVCLACTSCPPSLRLFGPLPHHASVAVTARAALSARELFHSVHTIPPGDEERSVVSCSPVLKISSAACSAATGLPSCWAAVAPAPSSWA